MLAGPVANFLLAIGIFSLMFVSNLENRVIPEVSEISSKYLLQNSNLREGDILTSINGKNVSNLQDIRLELLSLSGTSGTIDFKFEANDRQSQYNILVPVKDYLSNTEEQNAPEKFLGFSLSIKLQPTVGDIAENSKAIESGLKVNDRFLAVNNKPIHSFEDLRIFLKDYKGPDIDAKIQRSDKTIYLNIPLSTRINDDGVEEKFIGILPGFKNSLFDSFIKGTYVTYNLSVKTLTLVGKMITGDLGTQNLSGPIGIVKMAGDTASAGLMQFVTLMALLSISLGVLNLLPIPVLDGGQLVMLGVEAVRGSPMPEKMENLFYMSGWVAVGFLMIFAVFNDISKFL
jgi:regulator of sigma E protease